MKKISKVFVIIFLFIFVVGCGNMMDTPTKKVETLLSKYQTQDKEIIEQLDTVVDEAGNLNDNQKDKYRDLMKKQYQNLSYKIKSESLDGDKATVVVEIQVFDYGKAIAESESYLASNKDEFLSGIDEEEIDDEKYLDYKIKKMADTNDKVTYTINFNLTKVDDEWKLNDLRDIERLKLHGLYY